MVDLVEKWKETARRDDLWRIMVPSDVRELIMEIEKLRAALESIAANSCCNRCQEAALVARKALTSCPACQDGVTLHPITEAPVPCPRCAP